MSESHIVKQIIAAAAAMGVYLTRNVVQPLKHGRGVSGLGAASPDLVGVDSRTGRAWYVEVKKPKGTKVNPKRVAAQRAWLRTIAFYGAAAGIAESPEEMVAMVTYAHAHPTLRRPVNGDQARAWLQGDH